jgi:hypothetical protein
MNARWKHRKAEQAKETDNRLELKSTQSGSGVLTVARRECKRLPVYRANLNHPVNIAEHGNTASPARPRDRADLTARRVRGSSFGRTEKAKASGNALDMPTSVWSILARELAEPSKQKAANDG